MNCSDIRLTLNDHRLTALSAAERLQFDAHLAGCSLCFDAVSAQRLLGREAVDGPREALFAEVMARVADTRAAPAPARPPSPPNRQPIGGLVAAGALVLLVVLALAVAPRVESPVESGASTTPAADATPDLAAVESFVEGESFTALPGIGPFSTVGERISAWIYFMWSCLHCYELESILAEWMAGHDPSRVDIARVPVAWNAYTELHARAFFAAESLGVFAPVNDTFFEEIHENGNALDTRAAIRAVFLDAGIDARAFDAAFDSTEVEARVADARSTAARFQVDATPTVIVDGRYKITPGQAGSHARMLQVADSLIDAVEREALDGAR